MKKHEIYSTVQTQLAIDLNCTVEDLNGEKDSFIFVEARDNPGRRPLLPEYRNYGLATYLVNALTIEILRRNIVPVYSTTACNIASQKVAYRAGYIPAWMSDNKLRFKGELSNA